MNNIKQEDLVEKKDDSTSETPEQKQERETAEAAALAEQDPLKIELEKVQKSGRTEKERAEFSLKKTAERVVELGGSPKDILGIKVEKPADSDDDKPLTVGMYKKIQQAGAVKSALQLADEISNETERELVKYHLDNSIKSTGIPSEDLKLARAIVNSVKNAQIAEEATRKTPAKTHSSGSGSDANQKIVEGELTPQELAFTKKPFNMTKEQILNARKK